jgi:hypothetical protein
MKKPKTKNNFHVRHRYWFDGKWVGYDVCQLGVSGGA